MTAGGVPGVHAYELQLIVVIVRGEMTSCVRVFEEFRERLKVDHTAA